MALLELEALHISTPQTPFLVGWIVSLGPDGGGVVQSLAELGGDQSLDLQRGFTAGDILTEGGNQDSEPLSVGDFVLFHPVDESGLCRATNIGRPSTSLTETLTEEQTLQRIGVVRSALQAHTQWKPTGSSPWLAECIAIAGQLISTGNLPRAHQLLERASYAPKAGPRRGSGYADVCEVILLHAAVYLLRGQPDEALELLHHRLPLKVQPHAFLHAIHLEIHLQAKMRWSNTESKICLQEIFDGLAGYNGRSVFSGKYSICSLIVDLMTSGASQRWSEFALSAIQSFFQIGARLDAVSRIADPGLPRIYSLSLSLPRFSDALRIPRALIWVALTHPTEDQARAMARLFMEGSSGHSDGKYLGIILLDRAAATAWNMLRARALEDPKFVCTVMYPQDLTGRLGSIPQLRKMLLSVYQRIASQRNAFLRDAPVSGTDFFGRREEIARVCQLVTSGNSVLIVGLRKSGKSSLLNEITPRLQDASHVVLRTRGLERSWEDTAATLVRDFDRLIKMLPDMASLRPTDLQPRTIVAFIRQLATRVNGEIERIHPHRHPRLVLIIDEIDEMLPTASVQSIDQQLFLQFLSSMRAFREESAEVAGRVPLVIVGTGIRESPCTTSFWLDSLNQLNQQNPLYQQMLSFSLPPFQITDLEEMVRTHGREMLLEIDPIVAHVVYKLTGGLPMAARLLIGTSIARLRIASPNQNRVSIQDFVKALEECISEGLLLRALDHPIQILKDQHDPRYAIVLRHLLDLMRGPSGDISPVAPDLFQDLLYDAEQSGYSLISAYHELVRLNFILSGPRGLDLAMWALAIDSPIANAARRMAWRQRLYIAAGLAN